MKVQYISEVKNALEQETLIILREVFQRSEITTGVPASRFRADHPDWMSPLDKLQNSELLLTRNREQTHYRVKVYALPLIEGSDAARLLHDMETIFRALKDLYRERLGSQVLLPELIEATGLDKNELCEAFYYMLDAHDWYGGYSNEFPFGKDPTLVISERVLTHVAFADILSQVYEWHFVNPSAHVSNPLDAMNPQARNEGRGFFTQEDDTDQPSWYEALDDVMKAMISEVDVAMRAELSALPTMGLRTLIDRIISDKGFADGPFVERLSKFQAADFISGHHKELLAKVLDAGNASAHRAYFPGEEDLRTCAEVVKHLIQDI